ncbi:MAG TPA: sigma-54 dependent transcriptional regulator [Candidatus Acidoferrales bacterium]|nr:sigma-54 dependent transcriptional regulator [Candidatus Acidoferrales bacterium]
MLKTGDGKMPAQTILIVDDEAAARYALRRALEHAYRIAEAESVAAAREAIAREKPALVLADIVMPGEDGIALLRWMREQEYEIPVMMVSALDTARSAVDSLKLGAVDYLVKGFEIEELRKRVANLLRLATLEGENARLRARLVTEGQFGQMLGSTPEMRKLFEMAARVAETDATVLILGESGTGKDLLAQEIHARSPRAARAFIAVNCAALPENLIESELFGYEKGAFTGAAQQKKGKFELADGGTLFLDEIGDMNSVTQAKVLRALENRTIERLGATQSIRVDVRVLAATHRDLRKEIAAGKFREDLYYRLRVVTLEVPALRAHKEDIPELATAFLNLHGAKLGEARGTAADREEQRLSREALETLMHCDWPGNVRELKNALERAAIFSRAGEIAREDLPPEIRMRDATNAPGAAVADGEFLGEPDFREAKRKFEIAYLQRQLQRHKWNISRTAATIGLHRQSLQEKLRELGVTRPGREADPE